MGLQIVRAKFSLARGVDLFPQPGGSASNSSSAIKSHWRCFEVGKGARHAIVDL